TASGLVTGRSGCLAHRSARCWRCIAKPWLRSCAPACAAMQRRPAAGADARPDVPLAGCAPPAPCAPASPPCFPAEARPASSSAAKTQALALQPVEELLHDATIKVLAQVGVLDAGFDARVVVHLDHGQA